MDELKNLIHDEFKKLAHSVGAEWTMHDTWYEMSKSGTVLRIRWSIERIPGVFVTIVVGDGDNTREYGLPYLVEFRGGTTEDLADATSDDPKTTAAVLRKFILDLLEGARIDLSRFSQFVDERVQTSVPPIPRIKTTSRIRPEWI